MLCATLLAPLLIAEVPPVLDYPNHLARLVLLAARPDDPELGRLFATQWSIMPNLAVDLIGPGLLRLLPVHVAGICLLGAVLLLNLAGVIALHHALFGRLSFWPLASGLMAYNSGFLLGFLNWQIGSGLAMLFAAAWLVWRDRQPLATILGAAMASVILFFCHLMGLAFFLALIGSAELYAMWRGGSVWRRSAALAPVVAGPIMLSLVTSLRDEPVATHWMTPHEKLVQVASPFINYVFPLDIVTAVLIYGGVALAIAAGWFVLAPRAVVAALGLAILYVVLPFDLMSTSFLDTRVAIMLGFLLFAAVDPARLPRVASRVLVIGLTGLFAVRMGVLAQVWTEHRRDLSDLRDVIAAVPPGASVYVTNVPQEEAPAYWDAGPRSRRLSNTLRADYHLPALLLIERGAFWPGLFANPRQQPIRLQPAYAKLAELAHDIPPHAALVADPNTGSAALRNFDFALMLEAGADPDLASFVPACLTLMSRNDFAALFRVRRDSVSCGNASP